MDAPLQGKLDFLAQAIDTCTVAQPDAGLALRSVMSAASWGNGSEHRKVALSGRGDPIVFNECLFRTIFLFNFAN